MNFICIHYIEKIVEIQIDFSIEKGRYGDEKFYYKSIRIDDYLGTQFMQNNTTYPRVLSRRLR